MWVKIQYKKCVDLCGLQENKLIDGDKDNNIFGNSNIY